NTIRRDASRGIENTLEAFKQDSGGNHVNKADDLVDTIRGEPPSRRRTGMRGRPVLAGGLACAAGQYRPGASDPAIKLGNTMPYSGPASAYGAIGKAEVAYFNMINEQGGINGRRINFITRDDGYSPPKTVELVRKMVEEDQVLALFQTLGTPPNTAIQAYAN